MTSKQFLTNISHEIRTPMTVIMASLDLLQKTDLSEKQHKHLNAIKKASEALLIHIDNILELSKTINKKNKLKKTAYNPILSINELFDTYSKKLQDKGLIVTADIDEKIDQNLLADKEKINKILSSLLDNAIKFTETGGINITIKQTKETTDHVVLHYEITDTGIGISPKEERIIWKDFSQVDGSTIRKYEGSGLGLSVAQKLAKLMESEIHLSSIKGQGSRFWFGLQLERSKEISPVEYSIHNKMKEEKYVH